MSFDARAFAGGATLGFDQMYPVLAALRAHGPREIAGFEHALEVSRRFRREYVDPNALAIDRRVTEDPAYVAEDAIVEAARHRFFTMMVPRLFGGVGLPPGALMVGIEEVAAGCLGIANLIAVHGLALCTMAATGDVANMESVCRALAESEREGRPKLLSTAITEPGAGTDVEDVDLLRTAHLVCEARPVAGGYRLNGRKVFISNGSIAHTHVVLMPTDRRDPVRTTFAFLVESGTEGFRIGRVERKMGQKACPAAELVFEDCFVPERSRLSSGPLPGRALDLVLGATRGGVGAFGAGVARGALERALLYARTHRLGGRWLIDQQWVQFRLADMHRNVLIARAAYVEALLSNELFGLSSLMSGGMIEKLARFVPRSVLERASPRLARSRLARDQARRGIDELSQWKVDSSSTFGAAAKVTGTDLGVANCHLAIGLMGTDGFRHDRGMEKLFRDAKLLQIYEGTNQLNRIEIFKKGVDRSRIWTQDAPSEAEGATPPRAVDEARTERSEPAVSATAREEAS